MVSRAVTKQQGYQRRCMAWSHARRERKGTATMVDKIVRRALRQRTSTMYEDDIEELLFGACSINPQ